MSIKGDEFVICCFFKEYDHDDHKNYFAGSIGAGSATRRAAHARSVGPTAEGRIPPMSDEEIVAEVKAVRAERRTRQANADDADRS